MEKMSLQFFKVKWMLFLLMITVISSCAGKHNISSRDSSQNNTSFGGTYYGKFCGPNRPNVLAKNKTEEIERLQRIVEVDDMDWACKEHDICYLKLGRNNRTCDELFLYILDHWALPKGCNNMGYDMKAYFFRMHPNSQSIIANILRPVLSSPRMVLDHLINLMDMPSLSPNVAGNKCFFDSKSRRAYLGLMMKHGGPLYWGSKLPKNLDEAIKSYQADVELLRRGKKTKSKWLSYSQYQIGLLYLNGYNGDRDEAKAFNWFNMCKSSIPSCELKNDMLNYKWENIGEDREEVLRGSPNF